MLSLKTRELSSFPNEIVACVENWDFLVSGCALACLFPAPWSSLVPVQQGGFLGHPGEVFLGDEGDVGFVPWVNGSKGGHGDTGPCSPCLWLYPSHPSVLQLHAQLPGCLGQGEHTRHWQGLQKSLFFAFKDGLIFYFFSNPLVCALPRGWESSSSQPLC